MCDSDSGLSVSMNGSQLDAPCQSVVFLRVTNTELELDKILNFTPTTRILDAKLAILELLTSDVKDKWNFGLFLPPSKGKAGKFLQEDRTLKEYPFDASINHLELKYKQRIYRVLKANANKLRKLHVKPNLRLFMDSVRSNDLEKVNKWLNRGLDPNFQFKESGETPLTLATRLNYPKEMIMALIAGGAHLDFRAADTMTPLHRAAANSRLEAIKVLLDLGQSPNTRDQFNLTPLYYAVLNNAKDDCVEALLYDHAALGTTDEAGLQEIHQACRFGYVRLLELLIQYGADINSQTSKNGNTPLHICAFTGQESCARILLFRGAERNLVNRAGHTAYRQAVLAEHHVVAELIRDFKPEDVVPLRDRPKLNNRRRSSSLSRGSQNRCSSLGRLSENNGSETVRFSDLGSPTMKHEMRRPMYYGDCTATSASNYCLDSALARFSNSRQFPDFESNSVQTRNLSRSTYQLDRNATLNTVEPDVYPNYASTMKLRSKLNRYPADQNDQAFNKRNGDVPTLDPLWMHAQNEAMPSDTASIFSTTSSLRGVNPSSASAIHMLFNRDGSILDLDTSTLPRMVVLQKGPRGFGFVVRGRRGVPGEFTPTLDVPALQYLDKIEPQSAAELAGLKIGDYILEVNGINVCTMPHEAVVRLIRGSGEILALKVLTVDADRMQESSTLDSQSFSGTARSDYPGIGDVSNGSISHPNPLMASAYIKSPSVVDSIRLNGTVKHDPFATLSRRPSVPTNISIHPAPSSTSSVPPPPAPTISTKPYIPPPPRANPCLNSVFGRWQSMGENACHEQPTSISNAMRSSEPNSVSPVNTSAKTSTVSVPPPPPAAPKPVGVVPKTNGVIPPPPARKPSLTTSYSSQNKTLNGSSKPDPLDDDLPLPPPPAELDEVKPASRPVIGAPNILQSMLRQIDKHMDTEPPSNRHAPVDFTDHLRKALEQRRQKLALHSTDDDDDTASKQDFNPTPNSTLYINSKNHTTLERSLSLSQTGESSFKAAAEKFHMKAIARNANIGMYSNNQTIPPPENFKDDNSWVKKSTENGVISNVSKWNGTNGVTSTLNSNQSSQKSSNHPIPPPPPICITKPPVKFKSGL